MDHKVPNRTKNFIFPMTQQTSARRFSLNKGNMAYKGPPTGDPLSPYLFVLYAKGFSSLLMHEEEVGSIDGGKSEFHTCYLLMILLFS